MTDRIAHLDAATEGGRELDYAIAKETGWQFYGENEFKEYGLFWREATPDEWKQLPWWTTSLDAALPGENIVSMSFREQGDYAPLGSYYTVFHEDPHGDRHQGEHAVEAIARRIAALKAREA